MIGSFNQIGLLSPQRNGLAGEGLFGDDEAESVLAPLANFIATTRAPITFYSRPPGDWFPLINNEELLPSGTFIGSLIDYRETDEGLWMQANVVSPGWFAWDPSKIDLKKKNSSLPPLTAQEKISIIRSIFESVPGGELTVAAADITVDAANALKDTVEFTKNTAHAAAGIVKYLPWIVIGLTGGLIYLRYGSEIKKAVKSQNSTAPPEKQGSGSSLLTH